MRAPPKRREDTPAKHIKKDEQNILKSGRGGEEKTRRGISPEHASTPPRNVATRGAGGQGGQQPPNCLGGGDTGGRQPPTGVVVGVCGGLLKSGVELSQGFRAVGSAR